MCLTSRFTAVWPVATQTVFAAPFGGLDARSGLQTAPIDSQTLALDAVAAIRVALQCAQIELFSWHFSHLFRGRNPTSAVQISLLRADLGLDLDALACLEATDVPAAALAAQQHRFAGETRKEPRRKRLF